MTANAWPKPWALTQATISAVNRICSAAERSGECMGGPLSGRAVAAITEIMLADEPLVN